MRNAKATKTESRTLGQNLSYPKNITFDDNREEAVMVKKIFESMAT